MVAAAVIGGAVIGAGAQVYSSDQASSAQGKSAKKGISEERRQFDEITKLLQPYVDAGAGSISAQEDLLGLNGDVAQAAAINAIKNSPQFSALTQTGEEAILQNAAATGGLRGGNTQAALAQFRPQLLAQLIESQFSKLGDLSTLGQASATRQAAFGANSTDNITRLLQEQGAAKAGNYLAQGNAVSNIGDAATTAYLLKSTGAF